GEYACHQFDVRTIFVGEIPIPCLAEIPVAPSPLLFAGRHVMIGDMEQSGLRIVFISADKIVVGTDSHVGSWNGNMLVTRNIRAGGVVDFVICSRCNGKSRDVPFAVVKYRVYIGWEYRLVVIIDLYRR